jgi:hypothetical protein
LFQNELVGFSDFVTQPGRASRSVGLQAFSSAIAIGLGTKEFIMAKLTAAPDIIIVDVDAGETSGSTSITYDKDSDDELWESTAGGVQSSIDVRTRVGTATSAEFTGTYKIDLKPGSSYLVGVFQAGHGPLTTDPIRLASLNVFCLLKRPTDRALITDENRSFGGTWYFHQIHTTVPTSVVSIAVSRFPPKIDSLGIPHPVKPDGEPTSPLVVSNDHKVQIKPILPGNTYFFSAVVMDAKGNWDIRQESFTSLRRAFTVLFPMIHIFNDGDPFSHGEGEFWFRVYFGPQNMPKVIEDFHQSTMDIDDWSETSRPYNMSFVHTGAPLAVKETEVNVSVSAWGLEHDGVFESDEACWSKDVVLPFPAGMFIENSSGSFTMDCPSVTDDDFHYGTDVVWSVHYVP